MKKIILLFLVLVNTSLFANDSERDIFYKRAKSLVRRQQLESALSLYERILKNYEPTNNIVKDYLNLVLRINEDSFLKTLERYKNDIDELTYITKQIDFLQKKGELKKSHSVADKYLKNNNNIKDYLT
ncbi:MAG: hypothetical protein U9N34_08640, partial [Candidatus Cloacimonadota bacterium]|nr:hypothetical protein [Candidatus Cloacimonadota bacterium]